MSDIPTPMHDASRPGPAADRDRDPALGWELVQFDWGTREPGPPALRRWTAAARGAISVVVRSARFVRSVVSWGIGVICPRSASNER